MTRIVRIAALAFMLAIPSVAFADTLAPGNGSLVVKDGRGIVSVAAAGGIIGRFDQGRITIDWSDGPRGKVPIIYGAQETTQLGPHKYMYEGSDVHFYWGGAYRVRIVALGINLSAVGNGTATLTSIGYSDPGYYRVDGGPLKPFPTTSVKLTLGKD
jgi:hypothetical protein